MTAIVDDLRRIPMSQRLAQTLTRAAEYAQAQQHVEVTLEHLLLALTEDVDAGQVLAASHVDMSLLNADVSQYLGGLAVPRHAGSLEQLSIAEDLRRILEAAAAAASQGRRREINGAIVLAAIVGDGKSAAAHMLRAQGLTFEEAIKALQRAMTPVRPPDAEDVLASARARVQTRTVPGLPPMAPRPARERAQAAEAGDTQDASESGDARAAASDAVAEPLSKLSSRPRENLGAGADEFRYAISAELDESRANVDFGQPEGEAAHINVAAEHGHPSPYTTTTEADDGAFSDATWSDPRQAQDMAAPSPASARGPGPAAYAEPAREYVPPAFVTDEPPTGPWPVSQHAPPAFGAYPEPAAVPTQPDQQWPPVAPQAAPPAGPVTPPRPRPVMPQPGSRWPAPVGPAWDPPAQPAQAPQSPQVATVQPAPPPLPPAGPSEATNGSMASNSGAPGAGEWGGHSQAAAQGWPAEPPYVDAVPSAPHEAHGQHRDFGPPPVPYPQPGEWSGAGEISGGAPWSDAVQPGPPPLPQSFEPQNQPSYDATYDTTGFEPQFNPPPQAAPTPPPPQRLQPQHQSQFGPPDDSRSAADQAAFETLPSPAQNQGGPLERRKRRVPVDQVVAGQLVENIPRRMTAHVATDVDVRIARSDVKSLMDGLDGEGYRHGVMVAPAMSVKLRAPDGGFIVEANSPETQWIETQLNGMQTDHAQWRFTVTPLKRGTRRLQLVVSARTTRSDGTAADVALPEQIVGIRVVTNYGRVIGRLLTWALVAVAGGVAAKFGHTIYEPAIEAAKKLLN
jgi:hypothetical protein